FLTGAYYLAKRRGAEKTGLSFVFKGALEIILALIIFCITALFFMINANSYSGFGTGFVFGLVMCTAIAFLVLDVSAKRGFKKMGSAGIKYACMLAGSIVISNLLLAADGFGIGRYVPSMDDIESVHIDVQFLDSHQFGNFRSGWFHGFGGDMELVEFTDKAAVELIRQLHIESNENPHNYNTDYYFAPVPSGAPSWQSDMFRRQQPVTYILKNGDTVTRNIRMSFMQIERLLPLIVSDDYKITQINSIDNWLASKEIVEAEAVFASLTGERASSEGADVMRLYEAFKIDYLAETFDQRFRSAGRIAGMLYLSFDEMAQIFPNDMRLYRQDTTGLNVYVLPHYTNLIAELERQGFDLSGEFGENLKLWNIAIIKADYIGASAETSTFGWWGAQNIDMWYEDEKIAELTNILINVMQPVHIVSGEGYTLSFQFGRFGGHFVIPPAYNTVAEELFSLAQSIEAAHRTEQHENDYYYYYD
ncbi:MAG: hypothetical protein LBC86_10980, partial [Oscillospiraceae bacterium]|nr:hypothetical protein [Oscillospiraceae bacterium]